MWSKNFTLLVSGRIFTNIGDSLYAVASMLLIYELTGNSFYTGLGGFLTTAPYLLQFFIGPLIKQERYRAILIYSQMLQMILMLLIPICQFFGILSVWQVLLINPFASVIQQLVYPTQGVLLPLIVKESDLVKANSVMNATYQLLDVILYGISGMLIKLIGAVSVYLVDSLIFFLAMLLFYFIRIPAIDKGKNKVERNVAEKGIWETYKYDLQDGFRFIRDSLIPRFLAAAVLANFFFGTVSAILPEYAAGRGGSGIYGGYLAANSCGLLIGSALTSFFGRYPLGKVIIAGFFCSGISWCLAGWTDIPMLSVILFGCSYIPIGVSNVLFLSSLQKIVPGEYLGRVLSFVMGLATVAVPLGSLTGGTLAGFLGSGTIFLFGGLALLFVSGYWLIKPVLRNLPATAALEYKHFFTK